MNETRTTKATNGKGGTMKTATTNPADAKIRENERLVNLTELDGPQTWNLAVSWVGGLEYRVRDLVEGWVETVNQMDVPGMLTAWNISVAAVWARDAKAN